MSKDKMSLYEAGLKEASERLNVAIVNFTKSMNEAAKALNDFRAKANNIKCDSKGDDNEQTKS